MDSCPESLSTNREREFAAEYTAPRRGREMCTLLVNRQRESRQDVLTTIWPIQPRIERVGEIWCAQKCSYNRAEISAPKTASFQIAVLLSAEIHNRCLSKTAVFRCFLARRSFFTLRAARRSHSRVVFRLRRRELPRDACSPVGFNAPIRGRF